VLPEANGCSAELPLLCLREARSGARPQLYGGGLRREKRRARAACSSGSARARRCVALEINAVPCRGAGIKRSKRRCSRRHRNRYVLSRIVEKQCVCIVQKEERSHVSVTRSVHAQPAICREGMLFNVCVAMGTEFTGLPYRLAARLMMRLRHADARPIDVCRAWRLIEMWNMVH